MCKHIYNPETQYPKGTPFTYLISWSKLNISYYGVRYKKTCHPDDLWKNYFTSSTPLKEFRKLNGEPDIIKVEFVFDTSKEARDYEEYFLTKIDAAHNPNWINLHNGGTNFCNTGHSKETIEKIAAANRGKPRSEATKQKLSDINKGKTHSEETKQKLRIISSGKRHTEKSKEKMSKNKKGQPVKPLSDSRKKQLADFWKNRPPKTKEHLEKIGKAKKGKIYIHNFNIQLTVFPEEAEILYFFGFIRGYLSKC